MSKVFVVITLLLFGCNNSNRKPPSESVSAKPSPEANVVVKHKKFEDFMSKSPYMFWAAKQVDSTSYWVRLEFEDEFVVYQFHGQCLYYFFTNYHTGTDKVELLWSYKTDCLLDMDVLKQNNGVKEFPKHGDVFCEYTLVSDSMIKVDYKFPEWVKAVNKTEHDSIFPTYFYLEK
ncbi:hypothetical protein CHU92_08940 [Flavobacterium cyanobacteriorum]|uniref:Uncharacterized protein n=1 Tax=Flavobacterium cyanobacteriorum TaxID=2022802 RepID=A0A255Z6H0_9FLAO|nr:hypothetical protein [Flavobacterium cyanobacteriorum]OYQ37011.1 hypothetical protein CHU92_08940 [Flavobacterium cyanobacteriorum]